MENECYCGHDITEHELVWQGDRTRYDYCTVDGCDCIEFCHIMNRKLMERSEGNK